MTKKIVDYCKENPFIVAIIGILILTIFFRFYNYPNRWGLGSDQARDAIIVQYAIKDRILPLIGPFAASGPFVFGPSWYIIFIVLTAMFPSAVMTPWIIQSLLFVGLVLLLMKIGYMIGGEKLSLIVGVLTGVSPSQIEASTNLVFSSFESIISAFILLCVILLLKNPQGRWYFLLGLSLGIAITIHFQALPLLLLLPMCFFMTGPTIKKLLLMLLGLSIPFFPLVIFDLQSHFFESSHLMTYFLTPKPSSGLDKRWLTYVFSFWPLIWGDIAGGAPLFGYINAICVIGVTLYGIMRKNISKPMVVVLTITLITIIALRYFGGQLFENFLSFLQPFLLLITAWTYTRIISLQKYAGILLIGIVVIGSTIASYGIIANSTNNTAVDAQTLQTFLEQAYPHKPYTIYDYEYQSSSLSLPFVLFLYAKNETSPTGLRFGLANSQIPNFRIVDEVHTPYHIYMYDLQSYSDQELQKAKWVPVNPLATYISVEQWYKK